MSLCTDDLLRRTGWDCRRCPLSQEGDRNLKGSRGRLTSSRYEWPWPLTKVVWWPSLDPSVVYKRVEVRRFRDRSLVVVFRDRAQNSPKRCTRDNWRQDEVRVPTPPEEGVRVFGPHGGLSSEPTCQVPSSGKTSSLRTSVVLCGKPDFFFFSTGI